MTEDLSGLWAGTYHYPGKFPPPVNFDLELSQNGQALSGHITEPNTFIPDEGALAVAVVTGSLSGASVQFIKTYRGAHDVVYKGIVNADATSIEGQWSVGFYKGTFSLIRETGQSRSLKVTASETLKV